MVINPDPWDRVTKERLFLDYFLGVRSLENCKILNLKEVRIRFNTDTKQMVATSRNSIIITNTNLDYKIKYDLVEFEINFKHLKGKNAPKELFEIEHARHKYAVVSSFTAGSSFYQELEAKKPNYKRRARKRERAYKLSQLKLNRAIINQTMKADDFDLYYRGFRVKPEDHIRVRKHGEIWKVDFRHLKYSIKDARANQTDFTLTSNSIYFDEFGNNLSARDMLLSGYKPQLGTGGSMPLDYGLDDAQ